MSDQATTRCCMCPNLQRAVQVCPGVPGTLHPTASKCRFVRKYQDGRGWKYKVMSGLGESNYKARYQKPEKYGDVGWKGLPSVPWRKSFDEAQEDLNRLAAERGWKEWEDASGAVEDWMKDNANLKTR